ncbi:hypothetical protein M5K25_011330 [Dendrobium thyrsiflorum]|uniref:Uncharacterized protein n=1 Tax=Dendrobium thyrsiflorum TaxID=117978 RepID=A0ABD0V2E2_DENTH
MLLARQRGGVLKKKGRARRTVVDLAPLITWIERLQDAWTEKFLIRETEYAGRARRLVKACGLALTGRGKKRRRSGVAARVTGEGQSFRKELEHHSWRLILLFLSEKGRAKELYGIKSSATEDEPEVLDQPKCGKSARLSFFFALISKPTLTGCNWDKEIHKSRYRGQQGGTYRNIMHKDDNILDASCTSFRKKN